MSRAGACSWFTVSPLVLQVAPFGPIIAVRAPTLPSPFRNGAA
jgi:hypothetical protein